MAGLRNLTVVRGDTFAHTVTFVDAAGAPIDMSGRTWLCQARGSTEGPVVASITVDTTDAVDGVLVLGMAYSVTAGLPVRAHRWDLQGMTGGVVTTWLRGALTVTGDVSRV